MRRQKGEPMATNNKAPLGDGALPGLSLTGDAGSADAVAIYDDSMCDVAPSRIKSAVVTALVAVWKTSPHLAIALARVIAWVWPGFRRA